MPQISNLQNTLTLDITNMAQNMANAQRIAQQGANNIQRQMDIAVSRMEDALNRLSQATGQANSNIERLATRLTRFRGIIASAFQFQLTAFAMQGWQQIFQLPSTLAHTADKIAMQMMRIQSLTGTQFGYSEVLKASQSLGVSLETYTNLFQRFAVAKEATGLTTKELVNMTDTLINLGRMGGIPLEELTVRSIQLAQGVASGKLQGDELRAVLEGMPIVIREIARELGIPMDQLRKMASEGKISGRAIADALLSIGPRMEKQFALIPETLEMINQRLVTQRDLLLAHIAEVTGIDKAWKEALKTLERYMELYRLRGVKGFWEGPEGNVPFTQAIGLHSGNIRQGFVVGGKVIPMEFGNLKIPGTTLLDESGRPIPDKTRDLVPARTDKELVKMMQPELWQQSVTLEQEVAAILEEMKRQGYGIWEHRADLGRRMADLRGRFQAEVRASKSGYMSIEKMIAFYEEFMPIREEFTRWMESLDKQINSEQVGARNPTLPTSTFESDRLLRNKAAQREFMMRMLSGARERILGGTFNPETLTEIRARAYDRVEQEKWERWTSRINLESTQRRQLADAAAGLAKFRDHVTQMIDQMTDPVWVDNVKRLIDMRDDLIERARVATGGMPGGKEELARLTDLYQKQYEEGVRGYVGGLDEQQMRYMQQYAVETQRIASGEREVKQVRDINLKLTEALAAVHKDGRVNEALDAQLTALVRQRHEVELQAAAWQQVKIELEALRDFMLQIQKEEENRTMTAQLARDEALIALKEQQAIRAYMAGDTEYATRLWEEVDAIRAQNRAYEEQTRVNDVRARFQKQFQSQSNIVPEGQAAGTPANPTQALALLRNRLGAQLGTHVISEAQRYGIDPNLVAALIGRESTYKQSAVSHKGAIGIMQLMPNTAKRFGVNPHDPYQNITGGMRYLGWLQNEYLPSIGLGSDANLLAAYNAGEGAVKQFKGIPPYTETQNYVRNVLADRARLTGGAPPPLIPPTMGEDLSPLARGAWGTASMALAGGNNARIELGRQTEDLKRQVDYERMLTDMEERRRVTLLEIGDDRRRAALEMDLEQKERLQGFALERGQLTDAQREEVYAVRRKLDALQLEVEMRQWVRENEIKLAELMRRRPDLLDAEIAKERQLRAQRIGASREIENANERLRQSFELTEWQRTGIQAAEALRSGFDTFFFDAMQGKLSNFTESFKQSIDRIVSEMLSRQLMNAMLGADFSKTGQVGGWIGQGMGWLFGKGDIASLAGGGTRMMAGGGLVSGMTAEAVPIIAHGGEYVFTPEQMKALRNFGGGRNSIVLNINAPMDVAGFRRSERTLTLELARMLNQAALRNG